MASKQINRIGYGQVEPNHLSGIVTGQILAQLPTDSAMGDIIENGRFAKYDYASGTIKADAETKGEWMLIYNEQKYYDEREQSLKDFAMIRKDFTPGRYDMKDNSLDSKGKGEIYPRLVSVLMGDIFTTNCFGKNEGGSRTAVTGETVTEGEYVKVGDDGYLKAESSFDGTDVPLFQVVKIYTMPDGQDGVKLMRVK